MLQANHYMTSSLRRWFERDGVILARSSHSADELAIDAVGTSMVCDVAVIHVPVFEKSMTGIANMNWSTFWGFLWLLAGSKHMTKPYQNLTKIGFGAGDVVFSFERQLQKAASV